MMRISWKMLVVGIVLVSAGCERNPTSSHVMGQPGMASLLASAGSGPVLLETLVEWDPSAPPSTYGQGCAAGVNNEGLLAGTIDIGNGGTNAVIWDRSEKIIAMEGGTGGYAQALTINDRGGVLIRNNEVDMHLDDRAFMGFFRIPNRTIELGFPTVWTNNRGDQMGNYLRILEDEDRPNLPFHYIGIQYATSTQFQELMAPLDPARRQPGMSRTPRAECEAEALDDLGRVYGKCSVNRKDIKYRWTPTGTPVRIGSAETGMDFAIDDVNRYGEIIGTTSAGAPVYWSAATGKIEIPPPPGISGLKPVAINDRGTVLLSPFYLWGERQMGPTIAYWTRNGGTVVIDKGPWLYAGANDLNNSGVIAGCVGNSGESWPALWRIDQRP